MSVYSGFRHLDGIEIIIEDKLPKRIVFSFPDWPFTTFEEKDICWLSNLGLMKEVEEEQVYYMVDPDTNRPKIIMSEKVYDSLKQHFKETNSGEWLKKLQHKYNPSSYDASVVRRRSI
jgi:hypothetical protein